MASTDARESTATSSGPMSAGVGGPTRASIGVRTLRQDRWWLYPLTTFVVFSSFVVYGDGSARRDFVHVDDVAAAVMGLAARPDGVRVLNVGSGCSVSVREVVEAVAGSLGVPATFEHRPGRPADVPVVELDVSALRGIIEFAPRSLPEGLAG